MLPNTTLTLFIVPLINCHSYAIIGGGQRKKKANKKELTVPSYECGQGGCRCLKHTNTRGVKHHSD